MEYDHDALESKRQQIERIAQEAAKLLGVADDVDSDAVANALARLTPPEVPEMTMSLITVNSLYDGGQSRKLGNIYLNWKKLMAIVPDATIAGAGAATAPTWMIPFIALYIWNKLWCSTEEKLTENEAFAISALWTHRNAENKITTAEGFSRTNELRSRNGRPKLNRKRYDDALARLLRMHCIKITDGIIWLREWVRMQY